MHLCVGGNSFESIPESIQNLLKLQTIDLNNCKKLKYLPESIKLLTGVTRLSMSNCTSLDQNRCFKMANHLIMADIEDMRLRQSVTSVWQPGNEVPEKMEYKNEHGSSLCFSFKLLQHVKEKLQFYACVVLDRPVYGFTFKGTFMDEYGLSFCPHEFLSSSHIVGPNMEGKYVVLGQLSFWFGKFVKGCEYTAKIQFQTANLGGEIVKCGVIPLFDQQSTE